jgi:tetratricopeptide (TPR) repeat protein
VLAAASETLELRGRIEPAPGRASVTVHASYAPFTASTWSDSKGRFRFRKLKPGTYTVSVLAPGQGTARHTIEVSPAFANAKGIVEAVIPFDASRDPDDAASRRHTVGVRELTIPDRARGEYENALRRLERHDVEGAIRRLERAIEIAPQFAEAWNHLGTIHYQSQRYEDAEKHFREALKQRPDFYPAVVNLGGVLLNLGKYDEALGYNLASVRMRPEDALAHSQLGMSYFFVGKDEPAVKSLKEAKRLDAGHFSNPQLVLADIYRRRGDHAAAVREWKEFIKLHPDTPLAARLREQIEKLK